MPYLATAQEWLTQSSLLLQARPTTTRITTKYTLKPSSRAPASETDAAPASRALLTLKTYDPASGATLKYRTDKAAEVGRLVLSLSRLGRGMAGLPELKEDDVKMEDADAVAAASGSAPEKVAGQQPGGAKKGKKKGRK